jgi:hypothetical protein
VREASSPSLAEFLAAPPAAVAAVAPETMIYAAGGTRRSAALAGVRMDDGYARFLGPRVLAVTELVFRLGVRHLIAPVGRPQIFAEAGRYRRDFCRWVRIALCEPEPLEHYRRANWRVRLVTAGEPPDELAAVAATLDDATRACTGPRVWFFTTTNYDALWRWILAAGGSTRAETVARLFGEAIPPAAVLVSFGKPLVALDHLPPILFEETQCYWTQRPGYSLTEQDLRAIFYDRAFLRTTWRRDKTGRELEALAQREAWEEGPLIGLGRRLGSFWYPVLTSNRSGEELPCTGLRTR